MQKETINTDNSNAVENDATLMSRSETQIDNSDKTEGDSTEQLSAGEPDENLTTVSLNDEFEQLIKGKYKDAFTSKVQGIINKRFKEEKQNKQKAEENIGELSLTEPKGVKNTDKQNQLHSAFNSLINAGVDEETAYKVLHLDEMMEASMQYGASIAAKQLADSIRLKGRRPTENGLKSQGGFAPHKGAAGLTPEKRRELAEKALMGEHIGF